MKEREKESLCYAGLNSLFNGDQCCGRVVVESPDEAIRNQHGEHCHAVRDDLPQADLVRMELVGLLLHHGEALQQVTAMKQAGGVHEPSSHGLL